MDERSSAETRRAAEVRIGCSGWQYPHWRGDFYPAELRLAGWFAHYARRFDTVEINNSFYRLPDGATFARWCEQAPAGFVYAVKASRFLTHMKKLKDPADPLFRFFDRARHLGSHLGPVLYQLPPRWPRNLERLEAFLHALPGGPFGPPLLPEGGAEAGLRSPLRHVIEFRDPSWYDDRVFALLERHQVALCLHDMHGSASGRLVVGPFVYVRFHFGESRYGGAYDDRRLEAWGRWLAQQANAGRPVFGYFNNDVGGHAPRDAVRLRNRVKRRLAA